MNLYYSYPDLGALVDSVGVQFRVWAPHAEQLELVLAPDFTESSTKAPGISMEPKGDKYFEVYVNKIAAGTRYGFRINQQQLLPDLASRYQPDGVHGPSMIIDPHAYHWRDHNWSGLPPEQLVFYELHIGTFTSEGTFQSARQRLGQLRELNITAIELMPVADFPGRWNWGYDSAALWAPAHVYGIPDQLRSFVDEAHQLGMAVFLDVVYNHFGPDGAYATVFGPFCTEHHQTLWGQAINLDGEYSAGVRAFYIANARYWLREFHFDGLRLDATFALKDDSPHHFLAELNEAVQQLENWPRYLIAEDYRNLNHFVKPKRWGGYGLQAIWADDFHHLMERILTGINERYYIDYPASTAALAQTIAQGWYFTGQYSQYEKAIRGTDPAGILKTALVFCLQNHDQIGNRVLGDRLSRNTTLAAFRAASSLLLFLPELPLLFMGQEWAASSPFLYFTDHNPELGRLVTEGRQKEFKYQMAREEKIPDPQAPETFFSSKLKWEEAEKMPHRGIRKLYIDLLKFRRELSGDIQAVSPIDGGLVLQRGKYYLLVALSPHLKLLQPVNTRLVWHSESEDYVAEAMPPEMDLGQVHFVTPAAVLFMEEQ